MIDGGAASRLRSTTRQMREISYGRWLRWLQSEEVLEQSVTPAQRVTKDRYRGFLKHLQLNLAPTTVLTHIQNLRLMIAALDETADTAWMLPTERRLRARIVPSRSKAAKLRTAEEMLNLGKKLMTRAHSPGPNQIAQTLYRDGLMIALTILRPLRTSNLAGLRLEKSLVQTSNGWRI